MTVIREQLERATLRAGLSSDFFCNLRAKYQGPGKERASQDSPQKRATDRGGVADTGKSQDLGG